MSEILSKQQLKSKETKAKIFRAAKHILQKHGYEALSIKNICEEAGVSNGSFYHHFKTKDDLLSYYIEEQPNINPDLLDIPKSADEVKSAIVYVYLNYVHYCQELGVEFMANYYTRTTFYLQHFQKSLAQSLTHLHMCKQSLLCFLDNFLLLCYTTHSIKPKGFLRK